MEPRALKVVRGDSLHIKSGGGWWACIPLASSPCSQNATPHLIRAWGIPHGASLSYKGLWYMVHAWAWFTSHAAAQAGSVIRARDDRIKENLKRATCERGGGLVHS